MVGGARDPNSEPHKIPFCSALYKVAFLFPESPQDDSAYVFYIILVALALVPVVYVVARLRRQQQLLRNGQITKMKQWLLPVYYTFLWVVIAIYACKAIDITIVYLAVKMTFCNMNLPVAFAHAATFWTSEFWLMDGLLIFLASNSHGIATIRRAFFFSTVLWVINSVCVTFGIMIHMRLRSYPHHKHLWPIVTVFLTTVSFRFASYFLKHQKYQAFCFMDIADYISSTTIPALVIYTLRRDSHHWSSIMLGMTEANRTSIVDVIASQVGGHDRESMTCWSELLSQHAKILKAESLMLIDTQHRNIGASGAVSKARYKGKMVAIKECKFERFTKHIIACWCKEALISSNFQHRNIVKLIGICVEPPSIKIVMQYCRHGSLRKLLVSKQALSWRQRFRFLLDIAEGMNHLHSNNLVHRDLKTLNLLVDEDPRGFVIKICDFGSSRSVDVDEYYESILSSVASSARTLDTIATVGTSVTGATTTAAAAAAMSGPNSNHIGYPNLQTHSNSGDDYRNVMKPQKLQRIKHGSKGKSKSARYINSNSNSNNNSRRNTNKQNRHHHHQGGRSKTPRSGGSHKSKRSDASKSSYNYSELDFEQVRSNLSTQTVATAMSTIVGSVQFLAPEILENIEFKQGTRHAKSKQSSIYGFSADVYSYGCVIWELITRKELFKGMAYIDIQNFILSNKRPMIKEACFAGCPDPIFLLNLMNHCWQQDPTARPSFAQIIMLLDEKRDLFIPPHSLR